MMNRDSKNRGVLLCILSGLMLSASFPPSNLHWMAWFSIIPFLISLENTDYREAFRRGLIFGIVHYITLIYWVYIAIHQYGYLNPIISASCMLLLCFYMSLYKGIFSLLYTVIKGVRFWPFICASLWVGLEYVMGWALSGFPWCLVGYTQFQNLHIIQIADILGVYGISFIIILVNSILAGMFIEQLKRRKLVFLLEVLITVALGVTFIIYGIYSLSRYNKKDTQGQRILKVAIVQGNIDQSIKWNPAYQEETIEKYQALTYSSRDFNPCLVVWPETAIPFFFQNQELSLANKIKEMAINEKTWMIFGSPAYRDTEKGTVYYNRAYVLSPEGIVKGYYDKVHLVPFGEYIPLRRLFPIFRGLVQATGEFEPGKSLSPLKVKDIDAGVLICYEAIFPELSSELVRKGADLLINLTNDAWFGLSSAPYQHLSMAVLRAVENRRPLIRAANTGISAFINPDGRILSESGLFVEDVLLGEVSINTIRGLTVFTRYGYIFPILLLGFGIISVIGVFLYRMIHL